jgi:hypothetical protein
MAGQGWRCSIVLTADTYTSVLPDVARKAAEQVTTLVMRAGRLVPEPPAPAEPPDGLA